MKKIYEKPKIFFDSFELTESVASGCSLLNSNMVPFACPVLDKEFNYTIFPDNVVCDSSPPGGNDSICYHVPIADYSVYAS